MRTSWYHYNDIVLDVIFALDASTLQYDLFFYLKSSLFFYEKLLVLALHKEK